MWGVEQTDLGAVCVVDDEPAVAHARISFGGLGMRMTDDAMTYHAVCNGPSSSSSLPSPVPQYRGPLSIPTPTSPASETTACALELHLCKLRVVRGKVLPSVTLLCTCGD